MKSLKYCLKTKSFPQVFGRSGMLSGDNEQPNRAVLTSYTGRHSAPMFQTFMSRHAEGYRVELEHFIDVVQGLVKINTPHFLLYDNLQIL